MIRTRFLMAALGLGISVAAASGQTFTNAAPIIISDNSPASPYPSTINVSGAPAGGTVSIRLNGFSHTFPNDVIFVVQGPGGQTVALSNHCGGGTDAVGVTVTFSADAAQTLTTFVNGTFLPTTCFVLSLPQPGPSGPYSSDLGIFPSTNLNGTWSLWIADQVGGDSGLLSGGWSVIIDPPTTVTPSPSAFTYQGLLRDGAGPASGAVGARFRLYDSVTGGNRLGSSISTVVTPQNGQFTTLLDFGAAALDPASPRWLEVTVGGTVLTPRQLVSNAPMADKAAFATTAGSAATAASATTAASANTATTATSATSAGSVPWSGVTGVPANVSGAFSPWAAGGTGIAYSAGDVGIGINPAGVRLNLSSPAPYTLYQTSANTIGTWSVMHNETATSYWQFIATGTANAGGANDLVIATGPGISTTTGNMIRLVAATNFMGIGLPAGNLPTQRLHVNGNVLANNVAVPSSIRFKDKVEPMTDALDKLLKLEGVRFDWKPEWAKERPGREHDIGFVAEDVSKVFPEVVFRDGDGNVTGMDYSRLTAVAVQAIKQQQAKFDSELAKRDAENAALKDRLDRLERALEQHGK